MERRALTHGLSAGLAMAALLGRGLAMSTEEKLADIRRIAAPTPSFRRPSRFRAPVAKRRDWKFEALVLATAAVPHPRHVHPRHKRDASKEALADWKAEVLRRSMGADLRVL